MVTANVPTAVVAVTATPAAAAAVRTTVRKTAAVAATANSTEQLLMEQLSKQQAQIDNLMQQHEAFAVRLEISLEQQQAGVHSQIRALTARMDAAEAQQETVLMTMFGRMQSVTQQTIQQSIGALLPQLTQAAAGGVFTSQNRLALATAPTAQWTTGVQQQGGGIGVVGGSPPTPSTSPLPM
jgi:exonuclease VII large subunit